MIVFHTIFLLDYFEIYKTNLGTLLWRIGFLAVGLVFIVLVGVNLSISSSRTPANKQFKKYLGRGLKIFSYGLIITIVSYFATNVFLKTMTDSNFVKFGVLSFIGLAIILAIPFLKYKKLNLVLGSLIILSGLVIDSITVNINYLFWVGLKPHGFVSGDYFPVFPWFGVVLIGIFLGKTLYKQTKRKFRLSNQSKAINPICWVGKNSLKLYFVHLLVLTTVLPAIKILSSGGL